MEPWRTGITTSDDAHIWVYGHSVTDLMAGASFTDIVFLLHRGRLPSAGERRLFDAMLIAVADHGPGSPSAAAARTVATGNRAAPEAAVAAGMLAIGDAHAGAGVACFQIIAGALARVREEGLSMTEAADRTVAEIKAQGRRLPGFGHRTHSEDPRTALLLDLARDLELQGDGIAFIRAVEAAVRGSIKPLPINVDGAIAAVLYDLDFTPIMAKFLFMIGRVAGLTAQVGEEYARERPMRIRIPVTYDGPPPKERHGQ